MSKEIKARIINKHDTEANWKLAENFIPKKGEIIVYDVDDNYDYARIKAGDEVTNVSNLPFIGHDGALITYDRNKKIIICGVSGEDFKTDTFTVPKSDYYYLYGRAVVLTPLASINVSYGYDPATIVYSRNWEYEVNEEGSGFSPEIVWLDKDITYNISVENAEFGYFIPQYRPIMVTDEFDGLPNSVVTQTAINNRFNEIENNSSVLEDEIDRVDIKLNELDTKSTIVQIVSKTITCASGFDSANATEWFYFEPQNIICTIQTHEAETSGMVYIEKQNGSSIFNQQVPSTGSSEDYTVVILEAGYYRFRTDGNAKITTTAQVGETLNQTSLKQELGDQEDALISQKAVTDAINTINNDKADKATTLEGYGITDAYTKEEVNNKEESLEAKIIEASGTLLEFDKAVFYGSWDDGDRDGGSYEFTIEDSGYYLVDINDGGGALSVYPALSNGIIFIAEPADSYSANVAYGNGCSLSVDKYKPVPVIKNTLALKEDLVKVVSAGEDQVFEASYINSGMQDTTSFFSAGGNYTIKYNISIDTENGETSGYIRANNEILIELTSEMSDGQIIKAFPANTQIDLDWSGCTFTIYGKYRNELNEVSIVNTTGDSRTAIMNQKAVTDTINSLALGTQLYNTTPEILIDINADQQYEDVIETFVAPISATATAYAAGETEGNYNPCTITVTDKTAIPEATVANAYANPFETVSDTFQMIKDHVYEVKVIGGFGNVQYQKENVQSKIELTQTEGDSSLAVMSQKAITSKLGSKIFGKGDLVFSTSNGGSLTISTTAYYYCTVMAGEVGGSYNLSNNNAGDQYSIEEGISIHELTAGTYSYSADMDARSLNIYEYNKMPEVNLVDSEGNNDTYIMSQKAVVTAIQNANTQVAATKSAIIEQTESGTEVWFNSDSYEGEPVYLEPGDYKLTFTARDYYAPILQNYDNGDSISEFAEEATTYTKTVTLLGGYYSYMPDGDGTMILERNSIVSSVVPEIILVQTLGSDNKMIMSQKAITDEINALKAEIESLKTALAALSE